MSEEERMSESRVKHPLAGAVLVTVACPACSEAHTEAIKPGVLTIIGCRACGHAAEAAR